MMDDQKIDPETGVETTGYSWDGIEELNNPLPRWWLWTLYLCIFWAVIYSIAYPAWPLISGATSGVLGWSSRGEVAKDIAQHEDQNSAFVTALLAADMTTLPEDADLNRDAVARGGAVFRAGCSQCHGSGAAGAIGYPNLLDNDWLWGGSMAEIAHTVAHGVRNETDEDARYSQMPAFGEILETEEITATVEYVVSMSNGDHDSALALAGAELFADNCTACHGDTGLGDREVGVPNIADAIWLYGGDRKALTETIMNSRFGVMPAWG
jgi:cytochrome c oxidase cbb3-type subunit 3